MAMLSARASRRKISWEEFLQLCVDYRAQYGTAPIESNTYCRGVCISAWLQKQRRLWQIGKLSPSKIQFLDNKIPNWMCCSKFKPTSTPQSTQRKMNMDEGRKTNRRNLNAAARQRNLDVFAQPQGTDMAVHLREIDVAARRRELDMAEP